MFLNLDKNLLNLDKQLSYGTLGKTFNSTSIGQIEINNSGY